MVRVGVVGTSWWVEAMYLPALQKDCDGEVVAICGRNRERAESCAKRWGVPRVFDNATEMFASGEVDAVIVATSNASHASITIEALEAGLHVLCEKPLALNGSQANEVAEAAGRQDHLTTMMPFTYQYMPYFAATKRLIDDGFLGKPHHLNLRYFAQNSFGNEYNWRFDKEVAGSGVIGDLGSHWLYCAEWLFGPIAELGCVSSVFVERGDRPDGSDYERCEDSAVMTLRFANGAMGTLQVCTVSWEGTPFGQRHFIDVHGEGGTIYAACDYDKLQEVQTIKRSFPGPAKKIDLAKMWPEVRFDSVHNTYRDVFRKTEVMARRWIADIAASRPSTPDLAAGARVQHLIDIALKSASQNGALLPSTPHP